MTAPDPDCNRCGRENPTGNEVCEECAAYEAKHAPRPLPADIWKERDNVGEDIQIPPSSWRKR